MAPAGSVWVGVSGHSSHRQSSWGTPTPRACPVVGASPGLREAGPHSRALFCVLLGSCSRQLRVGPSQSRPQCYEEGGWYPLNKPTAFRCRAFGEHRVSPHVRPRCRSLNGAECFSSHGSCATLVKSTNRYSTVFNRNCERDIFPFSYLTGLQWFKELLIFFIFSFLGI